VQLSFVVFAASLRGSEWALGTMIPRRLSEGPVGSGKLTSRFEIWRNRFALLFSLFDIAGVSCFAARWLQFSP
jgi:hypothetical protein